jgi:hypothetical protein
MVANLYPLVDSAVTANYYPVANLYLTGKRATVCYNTVATDNIVVSNMDIGHKEVAVADNGLAA